MAEQLADEPALPRYSYKVTASYRLADGTIKEVPLGGMKSMKIDSLGAVIPARRTRRNPHPPKRAAVVEARVHQLHALRGDKRPCPCAPCRTPKPVATKTQEPVKGAFKGLEPVKGALGVNLRGRIFDDLMNPPNGPGETLPTVAAVAEALQDYSFGPPWDRLFKPSLRVAPAGIFAPFCTECVLEIRFETVDRDTGCPVPLCGHRYVRLPTSQRELKQRVRQVFWETLLHEADEGLRYKGALLHDPHYYALRPEAADAYYAMRTAMEKYMEACVYHHQEEANAERKDVGRAG